MSNNSNVPERHALIRIKRIIGDPKANPPIQPLVDMSASNLWDMVNKGTFPSPQKISPKITVWKLGDVLDWIKKQGGQSNE